MTRLYISNVDADGNTLTWWFNRILLNVAATKGRIVVKSPAGVNVWTVTDAVVTTYWEVTVTPFEAGSLPAASDDCVLEFDYPEPIIVPAWVDVAHDATDFGAAGAMTWGVDAADLSLFAYKLLDVDTVLIKWRIINSTLAGVASTYMTILLPAGLSVARPSSATHIYYDGGAGIEAPGLARILMADPTHIQLFKTPSAAWTLAANNVWTEGQMFLSI